MTPRRNIPRNASPTDGTSEALWAAFVAEARELLAIDPESMSAEQLERLEALSDGLIHVVGHAESLRRERIPESDLRLAEELRRRDELAGSRSRRAAHRERSVAGDAGAFTQDERRALRDRILAGLHGQRLRVREAPRAPAAHEVRPPRLPVPSVLREMGSQHRALVVPDLAIAAGAGAELWDVECSRAVDVPQDLPRGEYLALEVAGDSMEPLIHPGDMVLVRVEQRVTPGTVVVARDPEHGYVVKAVGDLTSDEIELRSLNPRFSPIKVPQQSGAILGTVVMRWRAR